MLADAGAATQKIIREKYFTKKKALNKDDVKNKCAFWTPLFVEDRLEVDLLPGLEAFTHSKYTMKTVSDYCIHGRSNQNNAYLIFRFCFVISH